jgi:hypothetical protein
MGLYGNIGEELMGLKEWIPDAQNQRYVNFISLPSNGTCI